MNERQREILKIVSETGEISISVLSERLNTSQVTVRKDVEQLSAGGYVCRRHGSVSAVSADDVAGRMLCDYDKKFAVAQRALTLIKNNDTLFIESGSTCAILAKLIAEKRRGVTIITNSLFIAEFIREYETVKVIVLGGDYQRDARVVVGPLTALSAKQFYGKFLFCGVDGIAEETGFTINDHLRAFTVGAMAEYAEKVVVLTDSSKFLCRGAAAQFEFNQVDCVITDSGIDKVKKEFLEDKGIKVVIS